METTESMWPISDHTTCIPSEGCRVQPGLTLRDYFAGQAPEMPNHWERFARSADDPSAAWIAREARWRYAYADAMLAERERSR